MKIRFILKRAFRMSDSDIVHISWHTTTDISELEEYLKMGGMSNDGSFERYDIVGTELL